MAPFFKKDKKSVCPIDEKGRLWMERTFNWLLNTLNRASIKEKNILFPNETCFPIKFDASDSSAYEVLKIITAQMDINFEEIDLSFYDQGIHKFRTGLGHAIFTQFEKHEPQSAGLYFGKNKNGKYDIAIEISQLKKPESLISTIAHELAHIKLLDKLKIQNADEYLTDLLPLFYGLGIFSANASFQFYKDTDSWGYSVKGYLTEMAWGYALALYAYIRDEIQPEWIKFLSPNIKSYFIKSTRYIHDNEGLILCK